jgi:hypothetical protein
MKRILALMALSTFGLALTACVADTGDEGGDDSLAADVAPAGNKSIMPTKGAAKSGGTASAKSNGISYHNGPVMTSPINVYYIWYGNWSGNTAVSILEDLAKNIGGSPYWHINATYTNASKVSVSQTVNFVKSVTDNYSKGTALTDANIQSIVSAQISSGALPKDANGVYFVLTSSDVNATSGFCSQYCGWHTNGTISGSDIKYSFVGNPDRCPSSCEAQTSGPNGNPGADGMASILIHELEEAASDPDLNGWYDSQGYENADKCAWTFGTQSTAANGAKYNVTLGSRQYLIQQNWVAASGGYCAMSY